MPPKPKITREQILEGALALVREKGSDELTAKALAKKLSCSTQPIFWHFSNMEELKGELFREALRIFGECLRRKEEDLPPYMTIGMNYISFAEEERELFRLLFMSDFGCIDVFGARIEMQYILNVLEESEHIVGEKAQTIYRDMWLFSHGIAAMIAAGAAKFSKEEVRSMLSDVCRGLIGELKNKE